MKTQNRPAYYSSKKAFTLVELSIVLVIIGLLTAGMVGGQSLIDSAKRQKVVSELNGFTTAINAFKLEYDALPGDFSTASSYWTTTTHNGNANGQMNYMNESYYFWEHLALAKVISGAYNGSVPAEPYGTAPTIGEDVPASPFEGYYFPMYMSQLSTVNNELGIASAPSIFYNFILITKAASASFSSPLLTPKQAKAIDGKLDDGLPTKGNFRSGVSNTYSGVSCGTTTDINALYNVAYGDTKLCQSGLIFN